jgi:hypothetical protein
MAGRNSVAEDMGQRNLGIIAEAVEAREQAIKKPFLVRGARLRCDQGTHPRLMNLPVCHGVYLAGQAMAYKEDYVAGEDGNISPFGVCNSSTPPEETRGTSVTLKLTGEDGTVSNVQGCPCNPVIVGKWMNCHPTTLIATNESAGAAGDDPFLRKYMEALTMDSFLVCKCGGLIEPIESGQKLV